MDTFFPCSDPVAFEIRVVEGLFEVGTYHLIGHWFCSLRTVGVVRWSTDSLHLV